jgi:predicted transcriptional regulator
VPEPLTPDQRRVLEALARVHEQDRAPSAQAVALEAGAEPGPVRTVLNTLHELGYIEPSLALTDTGADAVTR